MIIMDVRSGKNASVFSRFLDLLKDKEWWIIGAIAVAGFLFGYLGFGRYYRANDETLSAIDRIYFTLQLISMEFNYIGGNVPWELTAARFILPILTIYTIMRAILEAFRYRVSLLRIRLMRKHTIIAGLGEKGAFIMEDLRRHGDEVVGIEILNNSPSLARAKEIGARVVIGDAAQEEILIKAGIQRAKLLIVTCDDESTNIEVAKKAAGLRLGKPLRSVIHLSDMQFCPVVEASNNIGDLRFFNIFDSGSRQMLKKFPPDVYGKGNPIRIAIIGFEALGESVLHQALKIGHYANDRRLHIDIIDEEAEKKGRVFEARYPQVKNIHDIKVRYLDTEMDALGRFDPTKVRSESGTYDITYLCFEDDSMNQSCALNINRYHKGPVMPMVINMIENIGFSRMLQREKNSYMTQNKLHMFSPLREACSRENIVKDALDEMARSFHLHYLRMRMDNARKAGEELDRSEPSLRPWEELPETLRASNRHAADHIDVKLRAVNCKRVPNKGNRKRDGFKFTSKEIDILGKMEHNRWNAERFLDGWSYGKKRDPIGKKSPYLVKWDELSEEIQEYDKDFIRTIPNFLRSIKPDGYRIKRRK